MNAILDLRPDRPRRDRRGDRRSWCCSPRPSRRRARRRPRRRCRSSGLVGALVSVWLLGERAAAEGSVLAGALAADDFALFLQALILAVAIVTVLLSPRATCARTASSAASTTRCCCSPSWACWASSRASSCRRCSWRSRSCRWRSTRLAGMRPRRGPRARSRRSSTSSPAPSPRRSSSTASRSLYGVERQHLARPRSRARSASLRPAAAPLAVLGAALAARRLRLQGRERALPHVGARRLRGRADHGDRASCPRASRRPPSARCCASSTRPCRPSPRHWQPLVAVLAIVTMVVGNLAALAQTQPQAHAGLLLDRPRGLPAGRARGGARASPARPILFYLVAYAAVNLGGLRRDRRARARTAASRSSLADLAGLAERRPALAAALTVFLVSLTGDPGHRRLRRQVLPVQRRGRRRLGGARSRGRADERRVRLLLPAGRGGDVHARARGRGRLGAGLAVRGARARALGRRHAAASASGPRPLLALARRAAQRASVRSGARTARACSG